MENNQQNAVAVSNGNKPITIASLMGNENVKARFNDVLGKKASGFISSVISVGNSSALVGTDPKTIMSAAMVAATLDLPINANLGFSYIVSYTNKGVKEAQFQMGYKGFIQLAMRSGQYKTINATDIREGEIINEDLLSGEIEFKKLPDAARVKAPIIGYAAFFRLLNGFEKTLYMTKDEINAHALKYSSSYRNDKYGTALWKTQFDMMAKKTVLKLLISKYGPLSVEMQMAQKFDQAVVRADENLNIEDAEYSDNVREDVEFQDVETPAEMAAAKAAAFAAASKGFSEKDKTK